MRYFGDKYIEEETPPLYPWSLISESDSCVVYELEYSAVKECLKGESLSSIYLKNEHTKELFNRVNRCERIPDLS